MKCKGFIHYNNKLNSLYSKLQCDDHDTLNGNVCYEAEVIRCVAEGGELVGAHLPGVRHGERLSGLQVRGMKDIIKDVLLLPRVPDLPRGVLQVTDGVRGLEGRLDIRGQGLQDGLRGLGIKVPSEDDGATLPDLLHPGHQVPALLLPDVGQERSPPRLEVRGHHHNLPPAPLLLQRQGQRHLVGRRAPSLQDFVILAERLEF